MRLSRTRTSGRRLFAATAGILLSLGGVAPSDAQADRMVVSTRTIVPATAEENALERGRYAVLIDLDKNILYFKQGETTLWSAPVGTGTGMRVITDKNDWKFSTPTGRFQVQYKERNPIWIAPDWYFVENNLPVPAANHPSRYMRGTLGEAAIYISPDLAIHGTDRPELLGQRVSHGCIRLENRYAVRLFHNVQVGTEVIIVGGDKVEETARVVDLREGYDPSLASRGRRTPPPVDEVYEGWKRQETEALLRVLDGQLAQTRNSRWDQVANILVDRAIADDEAALMGLLGRAGGLPTATIEKEWGTLLSEIYRRNTVSTLEALADLTLRQRRKAAELLVEASVTLFAGEFDSPATPWPTTRIPRDLTSRRAQWGQEAIVSAERAHRSRVVTAAAS